MDQAFTERWALALESGEYVQGAGYFRRRNDDGAVCHCVVGVALDLLIQDGHAIAWRENHGGIFDSGGCRRFAHSATFEQMGIDPADASKLTTANDTGQSFTTLAKMVRRMGAKRQTRATGRD